MGKPEVWEMRDLQPTREGSPMRGADDKMLRPNGVETRLIEPDDTDGRLSRALNADDDGSSHTESNRFHRQQFNHSRYATRKTAAQGMMDMALMLANASQLKSVLQEGPVHRYYTLLLILIILSICLQVVTGLILLVVGAREANFEDDNEKRNQRTSRLNNVSVGLVFLITVTNVFITSFGINGNTSAMSTSGHGSGSVYTDDAEIGRGNVNGPDTVT